MELQFKNDGASFEENNLSPNKGYLTVSFEKECDKVVVV